MIVAPGSSTVSVPILDDASNPHIDMTVNAPSGVVGGVNYGTNPWSHYLANPIHTLTLSEDSAYVGKLMGSDIDSPGVTFLVGTAPIHGSLVLDATSGRYNYTPTANYNGSDSFTFKVNDGTVDSATATVNITVSAVNDSPAGGVTITGTATQGQTLTATNSLADADGLGTIAYTWKANGATVGTGSTYTLTQAEVGKTITATASFTDLGGTAESVASSATASVANVNDLPTGSVTITGTPTQGQTLTASNTLADVDGIPTTGTGAISYQWLAGGVNIAGATGNNLVLTQDQVGKAITVKASYTDNGASAESVTSAATGAVVNVNDAPIATTATVTTAEDIAKTGMLVGTDVDGNTLTFARVANPTNGTVSVNATTGAYTYTPNANFNGTESFTYQVNDGTVDSAAATVNITVSAVNDAPVATTATVTTTEDTAKTGTLAGTDVDGNTLTYARVANPTNGTVSVNTTTGAYTYTPNANFNGSDSFTYKVNDGTVDSATATVIITVSAVNDAPVATAAIVTTAEDTAKTGTLAGTDVDGNALTFAKVADPSHGTVSITSSTGAYTYTPRANYNGSDSFTFKVNDGTVDSATTTMNIIVSAVNDAPVGGVTITGTATQNQTLTANNSITDADAIPTSGAGAISYQWLADNTNITGATSSTFTLAQAQVGKSISVKASYTDQQGSAESVTSSATGVVANINDAPAGSVTITGTPTQGQTLTASNSITDADGIPTSGTGAISYQWLAGGVNIAGATSNTLLLGANQIAKIISVKANYIDNFGTSESITSTATSSVNAAPVAPVTISGAVIDGYVSGSTVFADLNGDLTLNWTDQDSDGKYDDGEGEAWTTSDTSGAYSFTTSANLTGVNLVATLTHDVRKNCA